MGFRDRKTAKAAIENEDDMAPLFPSIPVREISSIGVSVVARIDSEPRAYPLGQIGPSSSEEDIFENFGGGDYEITAHGKNNAPIKDAFRSLSLPGEPKWLDAVKQAIAGANISSEQVVAEHNQPGFGGPWGGMPGPQMPGMPGFGGPWGGMPGGMQGMPGMMPGMPGMMPGFGGPWGGMFGQQTAPPIEIDGPDGKVPVDPRLPPREAQRRYDEIAAQRSSASSEKNSMAMMMQFMAMMMQMNSGKTSDTDKSLKIQVEMLDQDNKRLRAQIEAMDAQQRFAVNQANNAITELHNAQMRFRQDVAAAETAANGRTRERENEVVKLKGEIEAMQNRFTREKRELEEKILAFQQKEIEHSRQKMELEMRLKGDGKFNSEKMVETVAGIAGIAAGVAKDMGFVGGAAGQPPPPPGVPQGPMQGQMQGPPAGAFGMPLPGGPPMGPGGGPVQ